mgnify:CR=1 FL=1
MRGVIQRVSSASVVVNDQTISKIGSGLMVLLGIEDSDSMDDIEWLSKKIANLRIFNDPNGVMNLSLTETGRDAIVVSQFTLHANTKKGHRPSYIHAAKPDIAIPMYESFVQKLEIALDKRIGTGEFGADMQVALINDGPVTILLDSKNKG